MAVTRAITGDNTTLTESVALAPIVDITPIEPAYNIWLSEHPFQKLLTIQMDTTGNHPTIGMIFSATHHKDRIQLSHMEKGTPAAKTPRWSSTLKRVILLKLGNHHITKEDHVRAAVQDHRERLQTTAILSFATVQHHGIHPTEGSLMLYYNQLNVIAKHLNAAYPQPSPTNNTPHVRHTMGEPPPAPNIPNSTESTDTVIPPLQSELGQFFTLKQLKKRSDWDLWCKARFKMLYSYQEHHYGHSCLI
jgi:hypothetical protein